MWKKLCNQHKYVQVHVYCNAVMHTHSVIFCQFLLVMYTPVSIQLHVYMCTVSNHFKETMEHCFCHFLFLNTCTIPANKLFILCDCMYVSLPFLLQYCTRTEIPSHLNDSGRISPYKMLYAIAAYYMTLLYVHLSTVSDHINTRV